MVLDLGGMLHLLTPMEVALERDVALATALLAHRQRRQECVESAPAAGSAWQVAAWREQM